MFSFLTNNNKHIVKDNMMASLYKTRPNLIDRLPWRDFNTKHKVFLLEDGESLGVCFKIQPIPCEARPQTMMEEIVKSIGEAIKNAIPCEKDNPWTLQFYISKKSDLTDVYEDIKNYFPDERKKTSLTQDFLNDLKEHLEYVSREGGIFFDSQVTNLPFRAGITQIYAVLYRRIKVKKANARRSNLEDIVRISRKFMDQLHSCGIQIKRMDGDYFYEWLKKWFNPGKKITTDYPKDHEKPVGHDLAEQLFFSVPESKEDHWLFNHVPHKIVTIQNMTTNPEIGHISGERKRKVDDKVFNLIDHLPEESIFVITVTFQAPSEVGLHLKRVQDSAVGGHPLALKVKKEVEMAENGIANGNPLFPVVMAVYLKGRDLDDLKNKEEQTEVLLNGNGFKVINDDELFPLDAYLRYLPMCYDFNFDKKHSYRSRYIQLSDIAKLLPVYGRSRGTAHPAMLMFNRGGEPWAYDMYRDRTKNAHALFLGETGTGKSNLLNFLITFDLALYNSRFFIIEAGGSFDNLGDYCQSHGLVVNKIKIDPNKPVSLNPFAHGLRILDQLESINETHKEKFLNDHCEKLLKEQEENSKSASNQQPEDDEPRDILGDMVLAALIMITGGEQKEEENIRRSDRMLIVDAIINAAYHVRNNNRDQMIANDIVDAFHRVASSLDPVRDLAKIQRAREMADAMSYFTKDPVSSQFFNSYGTPWPLADVTIIDFGLFAGEGYEAHRSIAFAGCISRIVNLAESNRKSGRDIKVVADENHIFTSVKLIADIETRVAKMGRKLGLWLWIATQNMRDFADNARKLLSQCEAWFCLALPPDEIDQIERFKVLAKEERELLLSTRKEMGCYTEFALLTPRVKQLARNIPPRKYLVMAATEKKEKDYLRYISEQHQCSKMAAVNIIAREMMNKSQVANHG
jgi:conjugative transfer ATPase